MGGREWRRAEPEAGRTEMDGLIPAGPELPTAPTFRMRHIAPIQA